MNPSLIPFLPTERNPLGSKSVQRSDISYRERPVDSQLIHQILPIATKGLPEPQNGRQQDVHVASLNFLNRPDVEVHQFGQFFLSDFLYHPLPANVAAESLDLSSLFGI